MNPYGPPGPGVRGFHACHHHQQRGDAAQLHCTSGRWAYYGGGQTDWLLHLLEKISRLLAATFRCKW